MTLPGKYDPSGYMQNLGVNVAGQNVLVVCPGNAGLAVAALRAGASTVVVLEPRSIYHRSLPEVSAFASEIIGATFSQRDIDDKLVEAFDIVFWSEGLDEIPHPKELVKKVFASMAQGAMLYWEINHGHNGKLPESTNAWRPTPAAFTETLTELGDLEVVTELGGRSQTRKIYAIKNNEAHKASDESVEERVEQLDAQIAVEVEKVDSMIAGGHLPTKKPELSQAAQAAATRIKSILSTEEGELDSIYEGRSSTPKSKKKEKTKARSRKNSKPKS